MFAASAIPIQPTPSHARAGARAATRSRSITGRLATVTTAMTIAACSEDAIGARRRMRGHVPHEQAAAARSAYPTRCGRDALTGSTLRARQLLELRERRQRLDGRHP